MKIAEEKPDKVPDPPAKRCALRLWRVGQDHFLPPQVDGNRPVDSRVNWRNAEGEPDRRTGPASKAVRACKCLSFDYSAFRQGFWPRRIAVSTPGSQPGNMGSNPVEAAIFLVPSSSGLGRRPFTPGTRVRFSSGLPVLRKKNRTGVPGPLGRRCVPKGIRFESFFFRQNFVESKPDRRAGPALKAVDTFG